MTPIPWLDFGGEGPPLHFLHANGYPPACYLPLLTRLASEYRVFGMLLRALWPGAKPEDLDDWHPLSDDLLLLLDQQKPGPVVGMGHSIGATVTLRAALRVPDRFRALVLLEPVLFSPAITFLWNLARAAGLGERVHPKISAALKRRRRFDSLERTFEGYRRRPVFRYFSDEALHAFLEGMTRPGAGGFELAFSPEWEARIYLTGLRDRDLWAGLPRLRVPTLIVRGSETDTFSEAAARLVVKKNPAVRLIDLERSTHLLPLERPGDVFEITQAFLKEVL